MRMVTVKQYAEKMASSVSYIRQMCAEGILPSVKIGKSYKIDVDRADEYFRKQIDERMAKPKKPVIKVKLTKSTDFLARLHEMKGAIGREQEQVC